MLTHMWLCSSNKNNNNDNNGNSSTTMDASLLMNVYISQIDMHNLIDIGHIVVPYFVSCEDRHSTTQRLLFSQFLNSLNNPFVELFYPMTHYYDDVAWING